MIYTVKGFSVVNEAEVDVFLKFSSFFRDPTDIGNSISGFSAFSKSSLYIWKFSIHALLKLSLKDIEHYSMWNEWNYAVVWTFFGIALLWAWNENWTFPVLWPLLSFPNLMKVWVQKFKSIIPLKTNNLFIYLFYFTIVYWFHHILTWICHGGTCVPHPEPPSHLPPHSKRFYKLRGREYT